MKCWVTSVWNRAIALLCSLAMVVTFLPAQPIFAETSNGYSLSISADKKDADVGEKITFKAEVSFDAAESTDTEAEDFNFDWYLDGEKKAGGNNYELTVSSLDEDEKEYEVYCVATGKTSGNEIKSNTEKVTVFNLYSIEFSGADEETVKARKGEEITLPQPSKSGNRFVEWEKDGKTYEGKSSYTVEGNATFTAVWKETVTVTFDPGKGEMDADKKSVTIDKGNSVPQENLDVVPNYEGHNFQGWYLGRTKYTDLRGNARNITQDTTLTARWDVQKFDIIFKAEEGKFTDWQYSRLSSIKLTKEYGDTFGDDLPGIERSSKTEENKKTEYSLNSWVSTDNEEEQLGKDTAIKKAWEVKPKWDEKVSYKVTYETKEEGIEGDLSQDKKTEWVLDGKEASCPTPSFKDDDNADTHYAFAAWYTDEARTSKYEGSGIDKATTLYAHYVKLYKVSFDTEADKNTPVYVEEGKSLNKTDAENSLEKSGYTLVGFYKTYDKDTEEYSDEYKFDDSEAEKITAPLTLYVKWAANVYRINYDKNADDAVGEMESPQERVYDDGKKLLKNSFTREGYDFIGWNTKADGSGTSYENESTENISSVSDAEVTLHAQWKAHGYSVKFHSNYVAAGKRTEETVVQDDFKYNEPKKLNENLFDRNGFKEYVWATDKEGKDGCTWYADGELVLNMTAEDGAVVDLYAIWIDEEAPSIKYEASVAKLQTGTKDSGVDFDNEKVTYTITIIDNGSGVDTDNIYYFVGNTSTQAESITKDQWKKVSVTRKKDARGNLTSMYEFEITAQSKGAVFVKAQDLAKKKITAQKTLVINGEETVIESVSGVDSEHPNISYANIRLLVLEKDAPFLQVTPDSENAGKAAKNRTFTVKADDTLKEDGTQNEEYSGIRKVSYSLKDRKGNLINNYTDISLFEAKTNPSSIEGIDQYKQFEKDGIKITGKKQKNNPQLDGTITLVVTAIDFCGNETTKEVKLEFDNTPPTITISANGGFKYGEAYYYNDSNWIGENIKIADSLSNIASYEITAEGSTGSKTWKEDSGLTTNELDPIVIDEDTKTLGEGKIEFRAAAADAAGNETRIIVADEKNNSISITTDEKNETSVASIVYDNTAPELKVAMSGGSLYEDEYYYKADNCGITVTIGDEAVASPLYSYEVKLENQNNGKVISEILKPGTEGFENSERITKIPGEEDRKESGAASSYAKVSFDAADVKKLGDGHIEVTASVMDCSKNANSLFDIKEGISGLKDVNGDRSKASFILDTAEPILKVTMSDGSLYEDEYYYKADNCGITVTIGDEADVSPLCSYEVQIKNTDNGKAISEVLASGTEGAKDSVVTRKIPTLEDTTQTKPIPSSASVTFKAEEMQKLGDGHIEVTASAMDWSKNPNSLFDKTEGISGLKDVNGDRSKASFILDMVRPVVTAIETVPNTEDDKAEIEKQGYPITDKKVYTDTNSIYYNKDVRVLITVEDDFIGVKNSPIKGEAKQDNGSLPSGKISQKAADSKNGITVTYLLEGDHKFSDLQISGTDYAGNPLDITGYKHEEKVDDLEQVVDQNQQAVEGAYAAKYGKVIDQAAPTATITYESADNPNMYSGEAKAKDRVSAYYNKPVNVKINFADNYELDGSKLYAGLEGSEAQQTGANASTYNVPVINITRDGRSVYTAYGTDRALNPTNVTENAPDYDKDATSKEYSAKKTASGAFDKEVKVQTPFVAAYEIVLDQTAPVFTLAVESPSSTNKNINAQGNRYYFNNKYTASFTVKDTNYDASKITVKKGSITSDTYNSETASVDNFPTSITSTSRVFTDSVDTDGVYRYAIYGSDKAGNALVPSSAKNLQSTSESKDLVVGQKSDGSLEKEADISNHIVVDKVKPAGELEIKTGKTTIYKMDTKGNVTHAEPYRKETAASFKITVDSNIERSPVNIAYKVDSTSSSEKKNVSNSTYKYNNSVDGKQNGKQIFQITQYKFTDLAGNVTTYGAENKIYLDKDLPTIDKIAPTISIVAKAKSGTNGYRNGQPLFRSDVPLSIVVSDPDSTNSSSGLADVTYQMYVGGNLVSGDTKTLNKANTKTHKNNYKDEKLVYRISPTVNVNGKSHNNNNLEVVVTAYDNAGNKREMKYNFGIDVTAPTVNVTYDNNSAQNQKYFKANRTATIAVTERNFEPSKFRINTQSGASISGWSHKSNGGNGDKDVWTATVTYNKDGNYTLEVSGEDLLGNKASDIKYNGTAPREFTVDKTFPSISVTYDNNDVRNGKYYKATRTATVNVTDVNFNGQNTIAVRADEGGAAPGVRFNGNTSRLPFLEDGVYSFQGTVTDMAGNEMRIPDQAEFVIDTKVPVLIFEEGKPFEVIKATETGKSDHPVNMQFFTEDGFAPVVTVVDKNISTAEADAVFEVIGQKMANHFTGEAAVDTNDNTKFTMGLSSLVFRVTESIDDVYHVRAQAIDMAGNESELVEFDFSINRFGSSYAADKDDRDEAVSPYSTYGYIRDSYYHNSTQDLTIYEYNTNGLKKDSQKVEMMKDGNTATIKTLTAGTDYTFEEVPNKGSKLRTYRYIIKSSVFEEEGDYSFTISSVDEAGHNNTTSRVHRGTDENGKEKLYVDSFPIDFVIDKTAPTNQLAGVKADRKQSVNDTSLVVDVYPEDAQTAVSKVEIRRWMGDTLGLSTPAATDDPVQTIVYEYYDEKTNPKPADTDTEQYEDLATYTDQTTDQIKINYEIKDNQNWQWVEVVTTDLAGNESTDIRAGAPDGAESVSYTENRRGFLVTTNAVSQVVNNMAARIGAGVAIVLILLFLFMRKRKKDQANAA